MDLTSCLIAYDAVMDKAREAGRENATADKMHAMRAAIEAYEDERKHVIPPTRGTGGYHEAILGAIARGWCAPECSDIEMDSRLTHAIAREVEAELARRFRAQGGDTSQKEPVNG